MSYLNFYLKMNVPNYVGYIWYRREQHCQPVQDPGGGQGVHPFHHDLDEVAGIEDWTKLKIWTEFWSCWTNIMTKLFYNKML